MIVLQMYILYELLNHKTAMALNNTNSTNI